MNIFRLVLGVVAGLIAITFVAETIEFLTVKLVSGASFEVLRENQDAYFEVRNRPALLGFKLIYNTFAAFAGGYVATWIAKAHARVAMYVLIGMQTLSLVWAGFLSELSHTGPMWMWIALIVITPIGIYLGGSLRSKRRVLSTQPG